ncbi:MAG: hypothetical protein ABI467_25730 [Kofleriaceae bacterium]
MRSILFALVALGACAEAGKTGFQGRPDGSITLVDSDMHQPPPPDAFVSHIDAPPNMMTKTLDQNSSDTITLNTAIACTHQSDGTTTANSYYRVFDPATQTDFHVTSVGFQVENSQGAAGNGQIVTVKVGTYNGNVGASSLVLANMVVVATNASVQLPEQAEVGANINAPIAATIPAGQKMYVEIDSPDNGAKVFMGVNTAAEAAPGYIMAPGTTNGCNVNVPTSYATTAGTQMSLLITTTGTY